LPAPEPEGIPNTSNYVKTAF